MGECDKEEIVSRERAGKGEGRNFGQVLTFNFANEVLETCAKFAITVRGHRTRCAQVCMKGSTLRLYMFVYSVCVPACVCCLQVN